MNKISKLEWAKIIFQTILKIHKMNKSWKTTSAGIVMITSAVVGVYFAYKANNLTAEIVTGAITSLLGGIGLLFAKDSGIPELPVDKTK